MMTWRAMSINTVVSTVPCTVRKVIDFSKNSTKWNGKNEILRGIFREVSRFRLQFVLYLENVDYILDSATEHIKDNTYNMNV